MKKCEIQVEPFQIPSLAFNVKYSHQLFPEDKIEQLSLGNAEGFVFT